jgi:hypothetical protein
VPHRKVVTTVTHTVKPQFAGFPTVLAKANTVEHQRTVDERVFRFATAIDPAFGR